MGGLSIVWLPGSLVGKKFGDWKSSYPTGWLDDCVVYWMIRWLLF